MSIGALVSGLGRALVSWGYGGGTEEDAPSAGQAATITVPTVAPAFTITIPRPLLAHNNRLHVGDTATLRDFEIRDEESDALIDPDTFVVIVKPENAVSFQLVWGTAPSSGNGDMVARTALGTFRVKVEITSARGTGRYDCTVVTTGAGAAEPFSFNVHSRVV